MRTNDVGVTAVCNLLSALTMQMLTSGRAAELEAFLIFFENMNEGTIETGAALDELREAVAMQREVRDQLR